MHLETSYTSQVGGEEGEELNEDQIQALLEAEKWTLPPMQLLCISYIVYQ